MEERERILKLLEDGKITAEEAARLLEALGEPFRFTHRGPGPDIGKRIAKKIELSLKDLPERIQQGLWFVEGGTKELEFEPTERFTVKAVSGDVRIQGDEGEKIRIKLEGGHKVDEDEKELTVKTMAGDLDIRIPKTQNIELKGASGDFQAHNLDAELRLRCGSGDVDLTDISGTLIAVLGAGDIDAREIKAQTHIAVGSGDVDVDFVQCRGGKIEAGSGDISLTLPQDANIELTIRKPKRGSIVSDFDFSTEPDAEEYTFNIGKPEAKLYVKIKYGDINIRKKG